MWRPLIGPRLHGWVDDAVVVSYLALAYFVQLRGLPLLIALGAAFAHFVLARVTDYPQGSVKLVTFRTHAFIELAVGGFVASAGFAATSGAPIEQRIALMLLGFAQIATFALSDYEWPLAAPETRRSR